MNLSGFCAKQARIFEALALAGLCRTLSGSGAGFVIRLCGLGQYMFRTVTY